MDNLPVDRKIISKMFEESEFRDLWQENPTGGVTVLIPAAHANDFWQENLKSIFREIPVERLIIGDAGLSVAQLSIAESFPRTTIMSHSGLSLGFSLRLMIEQVETDWFCYLHSDVYLPPNWFQNLSHHLPSADWVGTRMIQTTVLVHEVDYGARPFAGAQVGRSALFKNVIGAIDDDYVWRQEDFVFASLITRAGGKVSNVPDAFHYHQLTRKDSQIWDPSLNVSIKAFLPPGTDLRVSETQYFGILKYLSPTDKWIRREAGIHFVNLWLEHGHSPFSLFSQALRADRNWGLSLTKEVPVSLIKHWASKVRGLLRI